MWVAHLGCVRGRVDRLERTLSADEIRRARAMVFRRDRVQFVRAHVLLRRLLGRYVRRRPSTIQFRRTEAGKPYLADPDGVRFNMSHSGELAAYAFSRRCRVGVDVEVERANVDVDGIAARWFTVPERAALAGAGDEVRRQLFFACWVRKEAVLKAIGAGLTKPLAAIDLSPAGGAPGAATARGIGDGAERWFVFDVPAPPEYHAAFAIEQLPRRLRCWYIGRRGISPLSRSVSQPSGVAVRIHGHPGPDDLALQNH